MISFAFVHCSFTCISFHPHFSNPSSSSEKSNPSSPYPANFQFFIPFHSSLKLAFNYSFLFVLSYLHPLPPKATTGMGIYLCRTDLFFFCVLNCFVSRNVELDMYICVSNRQKSGKAECCGLAARSRQLDRQRDTGKFVCLPSQGGQSVWVERVILVTAIKREPC